MISIILCSIIIYSGSKIYEILNDRQEAAMTYEVVNQYVKVDTEVDKTENLKDEMLVENESGKEYGEFVQAERYIDIDFESLIALNSDFVGWLYLIDDNIINYPVVQGNDNRYYLNHLFDKTVNLHGTLFLDYRNNVENLNDNSIIYGHTMKSAKMFHSLGNFKDQNYYELHPYFFLETPEHEYRLDVFACYITPAISDAYVIEFNDVIDTVTDANGNEQNFYRYDNSIPTFKEWYESVMSQNLIKTNIVVEEGDKIVTMSACDYSFNNARIVIHCKVIETAYSATFNQ
jgi:sortase B